MNKTVFTTKSLVTASLLSAVSIVLSRFCVIYFTDSLRLSFGNIPIMLTGLLLGPVAGATVGAVSDILGSALLSGFGWYPPLTVTPMLIGLAAGLFRKTVMKKRSFLPVLCTTLTANASGTMLWSTFCLSRLYGMPLLSLAAVRVPFYIAVAVVEAVVIFGLMKASALERIIK